MNAGIKKRINCPLSWHSNCRDRTNLQRLSMAPHSALSPASRGEGKRRDAIIAADGARAAQHSVVSACNMIATWRGKLTFLSLGCRCLSR